MTKTSQQIRREFIEFFQQRGHRFVPSSSLLPADDPTLLFANAGMNQFKDVFLGAGTRPYKRAVNSQKCIRAGGKHNDLEDVGHDTYHQTFFEMLGNWSFGDYFKAEAIAWAWELLTKAWGLPKDGLWATVFGGAGPGDAPEEVELWRTLSAAGAGPDEEAAGLWRKLAGLPEERVLRGSVHDNFWAPGDTGPCGPCSEIHIDLGRDRCDAARHAGRPCGVNVSGCGRFIELWNLVFIQFNRDETGRLSPLPARHVDTGMGFERVCAVLQGKSSNYDTDVFAPLMRWLEAKSGLRYGGTLKADVDVAMRVVADHARACTFAIADGVLPGNEGRGYVIRRILRRAARFGRKLNQHEPFLNEMVGLIVDQLGGFFPEIAARRQQVEETIRQEEDAFNRTLDRGIELFERAAERAEGHLLTGDAVFELYATYGFPVDLTRLMAAERGLTVDMEGYQAEMERHRDISSAGGGTFQAVAVAGLPETDDSAKYKHEPIEAKVLGWVVGDKYLAEGVLNEGHEAAVVLDRTNFYGESGGQTGDSGTLRAEGGEFAVETTRLLGHCVLHVGKVSKGTLRPGQTVRAAVSEARMSTMRNHTATHLLNWALRNVLGEGVEQAGSVVEPSRLRFDFTHAQALTEEQVVRVEQLVNELILADEPVFARNMPLEQARKIPGVRAVFGEKYPDPARVVSVGLEPVELVGGTSAKPAVGSAGSRAGTTEALPVPPPVELCGGTHLERTGQAGFFKIVSQEAVAKGVRRLTGVTGRGAVEYVQRLDASARAAAGLLRTNVEALAERVAAMQSEIKQLRKQRSASASDGLREADAGGEVWGGVTVIVRELELESPEALRSAVDQLRQKAGGPAAVLVGSRQGDKVTLIAGLSEEVVKTRPIKAGDWVKAAAAVVGGSGGGRATMAQAGGKDPDSLPQALQAAKDWIRARLVP